MAKGFAGAIFPATKDCQASFEALRRPAPGSRAGRGGGVPWLPGGPRHQCHGRLVSVNTVFEPLAPLAVTL